MIFEKIREKLEKLYGINDKSKKEAYEEQDWEKFDFFTHRNEGVYSAISIINQVEAEYNNGWIPCDKEQPSKDGDYLILTSDGEIDVREYDYGNGWGWDGFERITYWQPLPQPPKGE